MPVDTGVKADSLIKGIIEVYHANLLSGVTVTRKKIIFGIIILMSV